MSSLQETRNEDACCANCPYGFRDKFIHSLDMAQAGTFQANREAILSEVRKNAEQVGINMDEVILEDDMVIKCRENASIATSKGFTHLSFVCGDHPHFFNIVEVADAEG